MNPEVDALLKIASAINNLAAAIGGIGTAVWLALFFKSMSANSSVSHLADVVETWLKEWRYNESEKNGKVPERRS